MAERLTRERRRELTRTALLDAAAEAFSRRGFHGASLDEIAEAAGFTRGAITFNFGSKEELFLAVIQRHNENMMAAYARVLAQGRTGDGPSLEDVSAVWSEFEGGDDDSTMLVLELRLYALRNPDVRARLAAFEEEMEETIARFITEQAAAVGSRLRVPPGELAAILGAAAYGLQQHVAVCPKDHDGLFERFLELVTESAIDHDAAASEAVRSPASRPVRRSASDAR
jgi:AcrR family transcriptional regulator